MNHLILALPGAEELAEGLAARLKCAAAAVEVHRCPDGEHAVRLHATVAGRDVLLVAHLDRPDDKTLPLLFAADAARDLGARHVGLVAPYLPYMRPPVRTLADEALCSRSYARLLSRACDFVITVQPHAEPEQLFDVPVHAVDAVPAIAAWLQRECREPVLVDVEGRDARWIRELAARVGAPRIVMQGEPGGTPRLPADAPVNGRVPVLLQCGIARGSELVAVGRLLRAAGFRAPVAVTVHALLEQEDVEALHHAGVPRIVSCDTVPHASNAMPVGELLAAAVREHLGG